MKILLLVFLTGLTYSNTSLANNGIGSISNKNLGFKNYPSLLRLAQHQEVTENEYNLNLKEEKNPTNMIGLTRYVRSGFASMFIGFGSGQFLQDRPQKGLIYLAADIGIILAWIAADRNVNYSQGESGIAYYML